MRAPALDLVLGGQGVLPAVHDAALGRPLAALLVPEPAPATHFIMEAKNLLRKKKTFQTRF